MSSIANAADSARESFATPLAGARDAVAHQARIAAIDVMRGLVMLFMLVDHMRETGKTRVEPQHEAQEQWVDEVRRVADATLFPLANSWYNGDNIAGKPRMFMAYVGGYPAYALRCEEIASAGYAGLELSA